MIGYRHLAAGVAIGLFGLAGCGPSPSNTSAQTGSDPSESASSSDPSGRDLTDTDADTVGIKGGETYDEYNARRNEADVGSYQGYGCTQDCSGHQAGYEWAEAHDVTDESECGGSSWSFEEGCVAYAREQSGDGSDDSAGSDDEGNPSEAN